MFSFYILVFCVFYCADQTFKNSVTKARAKNTGLQIGFSFTLYLGKE